MARTSTSGSRPSGTGGSGARRRAASPDAPGGAPVQSEAEDLDDRKASILKAVVAEYIESAQPVGSGHITGQPGVKVSSATVRTDMAALEREGYLAQPHTSAGRIPTDKGYRFFVDHLERQGTLGPDQRHQVRQFFRHVHGEVEDLLGRTSGLLAELTDYAAVVVGPTHELTTVRSVQLVDLGSGLALLIVVLSDGSVEKCTIGVPEGTDDAALVALSNRLTATMRGHGMAELHRLARAQPADDDLLASVDRGLAELAAPQEHEHVFVGGSSHMAAAFDAMETVRSVLSILEEQLVVVELIERIMDRGLSVAIGTEHGYEPLAACALVVAPLSVEGEPAGTIGVLGPTRMHYPRALAAVHVVGEQLSEHLSGSPGTRSGSNRSGGNRRSAARGN